MATGVSGAALCKARQELNPDAFLALNERLLGAFAQAFPLRRWHGLGVLAADGSNPRLPLGPEARRQCQLYQIPTAPIPVRLVRVTLANDETAVLATSLLAEQEWPSVWFKGLYPLRWGAEEAYKCGKLRLVFSRAMTPGKSRASTGTISAAAEAQVNGIGLTCLPQTKTLLSTMQILSNPT